jgi:hypothetical protein
MTYQASYEATLLRLNRALDQLESAVAARLESDWTGAEREEELAIMQDDRARLALDLDTALARTSILEKTNDEVLRRLDVVGAHVAAILDARRAPADN